MTVLSRLSWAWSRETLAWSSTRSASVFCAAITADIRPRREQPGFRRGDRRLRLKQVGARLVEGLLGGEALAGERALPVELGLGVVDGGLGRSDLGLRLGDLGLAGGDLLADPRHRRLLGGDLRLRLVERDLVVGVVEDDQRRSPAVTRLLSLTATDLT